MSLKKLNIFHFRNIHDGQLLAHPQFNCIVGDNGAGKTSILESIYYLAHGRSFRGPRNADLIQHQQKKFDLHAQINHIEEPISIGISRPLRGKTKLKKQGENVQSIAEFSYLLPIKLITATAYQLIIDGPKIRRSFLDWGVFHVEPQFLSSWQAYNRSLQQRNALLKQGAPNDQIDYWDQHLIEHGQCINQMRISYFNQMMPVFRKTVHQLINYAEAYDILFQPGWNQDDSLAEVLEKNRFSDRRRGYTQAGPHRADLSVTLNGETAQHVLSQGQLKMLAYTMQLSQGQAFQNAHSRAPIYLIDDICSELDQKNQKKIFEIIGKINAQVFITAIDLNDLNINDDHHVFHVNEGKIEKKDI